MSRELSIRPYRFTPDQHMHVIDLIRLFYLLCVTYHLSFHHRYGITHSGLDAMMMRYLEEMTTFVNLPNKLAYPNATRWAVHRLQCSS